MTLKISEIKGVSDALADQLRAQGIHTSDDLLRAARTAADRKGLSATLGISVQSLLGYANRADLARVRGIGAAYGDLLEQAGVDTVKELATRNPANLHTKLVSLMANKPAISRPTASKVEGWVAQAQTLGAGLEY